MRQYITQDQLNSIAPTLKENLIQIAGMSIQYKSDANQVHKSFTIGKLIDLINHHINEKYHIGSISQHDFGWQIDSYAYGKKSKELIDALWDVFVWCYDDQLRRTEIQREIDVWKVPEELVDIKIKAEG